VRFKEQTEDLIDMSIQSIEMPFESSLSFHMNQIEEFEYEKQVEEVMQGYKVCNDDNDPLCFG